MWPAINPILQRLVPPRKNAKPWKPDIPGARDFDRQVAGFQNRAAVLNGFTAVGKPITEAVV